MNPFTLHLRTRLHFGAGAHDRAGDETRRIVGDGKVMLLTGGGSVFRNGVFDAVAHSLETAGVPFVEHSGVEPNPRLSTVRGAIERCRTEDVALVLAIGGGSTIDAAKAVAAGVPLDGDVWDLFSTGRRAELALPVGAVLTLSATGSEYNGGTVVSDWEHGRKLPYVDDLLRPRFALLDPSATVSVPPQQTAAGVADVLSHLLEQYFSPTTAPVQDRIAEALMTICRDRGPVAVEHGDDLDARADMMWASSLALCGLTGAGKVHDWATHMIEHELSALYDLTHGVGLAILTPSWMEQVLDERSAPRFARYGRAVWGVDDDDDLDAAHEAIFRTRDFLGSLGLPQRLAQVDIPDKRLDEMAEAAVSGGPIGGLRKLTMGQVQEILWRVA